MTPQTPSGYFFGAKRSGPDPRDKRFLEVHPDAGLVTLPPAVDLRSKLPQVCNQGKLGSCGACAGQGLMAALFPGFLASRLQIYYDARRNEADIPTDSGVETRDILKVLSEDGAEPEADWPYDISKFAIDPALTKTKLSDRRTLATYSRLVSEVEYLKCLASGYPFILGFEAYESIDSRALSEYGVMPWPNASEKIIGGHDVLVVGYDTDFKNNPDFKASQVDPAFVSEVALLIRNSWGVDWGLWGHFWMPIEYATNPSIGGDAWTGRKDAPSVSVLQATVTASPTYLGVPIEGYFIKPKGIKAMPGTNLLVQKLSVAKAAISEVINTFTYMGMNVGSHVTDDQVQQVAIAVINALDDLEATNAPPPKKGA